GNIVHLFERDCSVQRRFQKVIEIAPSPVLQQQTKERLYKYALKIANHVGYNNAVTVEFLVDANEDVYFIEVNTRIQLEHTITEDVTIIDIVRCQCLVAQGHSLNDQELLIADQDTHPTHGFAIECRVTTDDPDDIFSPY